MLTYLCPLLTALGMLLSADHLSSVPVIELGKGSSGVVEDANKFTTNLLPTGV